VFVGFKMSNRRRGCIERGRRSNAVAIGIVSSTTRTFRYKELRTKNKNQSPKTVFLMTIKFFKTPADLRKWFEKNHETEKELQVGYYKKDSGKKSITWPESVAEALCFSWIDGIRHSVDEVSYTIRFTPRKRASIWSAVNIRMAEDLIARGLMLPAGLEAFKARREYKSGIYAYEQREANIPEPYLGKLKKNKAAHKFFQDQPAWYRKQIGWWIVCAKKEETRLSRLARLIEECAAGRRV
jgi:uncharacterized protein YdeI (YjbR/CyaY-like superfamily)